jgi:hypothetical protein
MNRNCKDCLERQEMEEEFSLKHDIKIAAYVLILCVALVILMAFFM